MSSVTESYYKEDDLAAMVSQGLAQANKRRKIEKAAAVETTWRWRWRLRRATGRR